MILVEKVYSNKLNGRVVVFYDKETCGLFFDLMTLQVW